MKRSKISLLISLLLFFTLTKAQQLYDDFEGTPQIAYGFINGVFENNTTNTNQSGINSSATCAKYTRYVGVPYDVIVIDPISPMYDLSDYLSGEKKITMMVKTDVSVSVQITLENSLNAKPDNHPTGRHSEYKTTTSGTNEWELLTFNFDQQPDAGVDNTDVDRMVILFDPGNNTNHVFYFDNIMGPEFYDPCETSSLVDSIAEDFDCQRNVSFDFSNGTFTVVENPMNEINNTSNNCGQFIKWTTMPDGAFGGAIDNPFTTDTYISAKIDIYDPNAPQKFLISMQDANNTELSIDSITTIASADWITYSLDFSTISPSESIEKFAFLFNPSTETEDTIYIDNFIFSKEIVSTSIPNEFENIISLYPNPVQKSSQIIIELKSEGAMGTIEIISIDGKLMETITVRTKKTIIDVSNYAKGNYIAKIVLNNNTTITTRITK
ncbi:MAG: T9SS type A sorting domain-containing protein [Flavobacteriales bacterium]